MLQIAVRMGIRVGCLAASLACASGVCQKRNVKTKQQESPWVDTLGVMLGVPKIVWT